MKKTTQQVNVHRYYLDEEEIKAALCAYMKKTHHAFTELDATTIEFRPAGSTKAVAIGCAIIRTEFGEGEKTAKEKTKPSTKGHVA